jgi:uncharacterized membrane protein
MLIRESIHNLATKPKNELTRDEKQMLKAANRIKIAYQVWPHPEQKTIFWINQYFVVIGAIEAILLVLLWLGVNIVWLAPLIVAMFFLFFRWWRADKKLMKRYVAGNYRDKEVPNEYK